MQIESPVVKAFVQRPLAQGSDETASWAFETEYGPRVRLRSPQPGRVFTDLDAVAQRRWALALIDWPPNPTGSSVLQLKLQAALRGRYDAADVAVAERWLAAGFSVDLFLWLHTTLERWRRIGRLSDRHDTAHGETPGFSLTPEHWTQLPSLLLNHPSDEALGHAVDLAVGTTAARE